MSYSETTLLHCRWWCRVVVTVPIPSFFLEHALFNAFHATSGEAHFSKHLAILIAAPAPSLATAGIGAW